MPLDLVLFLSHARVEGFDRGLQCADLALKERVLALHLRQLVAELKHFLLSILIGLFLLAELLPQRIDLLL